VHQQINFGRRKIRRQIVPPDNLEKEAECVYRLLNREVGARGEIDSLADSIFEALQTVIWCDSISSGERVSTTWVLFLA
jgi:hypothetical protein